MSSIGRYFKLPEEVKASLPQVKWASHELLGHEVGNRVAGMMHCREAPP